MWTGGFERRSRITDDVEAPVNGGDHLKKLASSFVRAHQKGGDHGASAREMDEAHPND